MVKLKNKFLVFALTLVLSLGVFAGFGFNQNYGAVYAASETLIVGGDTGYETFADAYNSANAGDTIKLEKNVTAEKTGDYGFNITKNITLDLNNHKLSYIGEMYGLFISNNANVTIKNGIVSSVSTSAIYINGSANLTLDSVTLENTSTGTNHFSLYVNSAAKSITIKGTTNLIHNPDGTPTLGSFYINDTVMSSVEAGTYNFDPTSYVDLEKFLVDDTNASQNEWKVYTLVSVTANTGLAETDDEQVGVPEGEGYTLSGDFKAKAAGAYTATVSLKEGYFWADNHGTEQREIHWSIAESETIAKIGETEFKTFVGALKVAQSGTSEAEKTITVVGTINGFTFDGNYDGIIIQGTEDNKITGNLVAVENSSLKGMKILDLNFENCGIDFSAFVVNVEDMVIQNCEFDGSDTIQKERAITININLAKNLLIDNNTITNYLVKDSTAILVCTRNNFTDFADGYVVTISNNTFEDIDYNAIQATGIKNLEIIGNTIINAKKNKGPINLNDSQNVIISGNTITLAENYAGVFYNINKGIVTLDNNTIKNSAGATLTFDETLANVDNEYDGVLGTGIIILKGATEADNKYIAVSKEVITNAFSDIDIILVQETDYTYRTKTQAVLSTNIGDVEFVVGVPTEFTYTTTANDYAEVMVMGLSNFSDTEAISKIEYYEVNDGNWYDLTGVFGPQAGFPLTDATSKFRVTFAKAGEYTFTSYVKTVEGEKTMASVEVTFTVNQTAEDVKITENGVEIDKSEAKVTIIEAEKGIEPDAVLVVKVVEMEQVQEVEETKQILETVIANNEKIYGIYDAKLLLEGQPIQPNGKIKIKMLVPEEVKNSNFKLYHIHNGTEISEMDYTAIDENGFITFETTKLSQFAFVAEIPNNCLSAWAIVGICLGSLLLLLIIIYLLGYFFLYRKGKLDDRKIKVIYSFLPRGENNLKEEQELKASKQAKTTEGKSTKMTAKKSSKNK